MATWPAPGHAGAGGAGSGTRGCWRWGSGSGETGALDLKLDLIGKCFVCQWVYGETR